MQLAAKAPLLVMCHDSARKPWRECQYGQGRCLSGGRQASLTGINRVPVPEHLQGASGQREAKKWGEQAGGGTYGNLALDGIAAVGRVRHDCGVRVVVKSSSREGRDNVSSANSPDKHDGEGKVEEARKHNRRG